MFNLNRAIAAWRRKMAASGIRSAEVLEELESHLRDDIEEQVQAGTGAEEAFESAVLRIGPAPALRKEFAKSERRKGAWHLSLWKSLYYSAAAIAILADLWALVSLELRISERAAGACVVAGLAWYLLRLTFLSWWRGGIARARFLSTMKVLGIMVPIWVLWELLTASRLIHMEIGFIPTMTMWSLCLAYGLTGLACGLYDRRGSGGSGGWPPSACPVLNPIPPRWPWSPSIDIPVPPPHTFTPVARKALELAREEALRLGHDYIGTEHVLLGVLRMAGSALGRVLERSQVQSDALRREIERLISPLPAHPAATLLPFTPRARKALQFAGAEAAAFEHPLINSEHVLLGLLIEGSGVAAMALKNLGVQLKRIRAEAFSTYTRDPDPI